MEASRTTKEKVEGLKVIFMNPSSLLKISEFSIYSTIYSVKI